MKTLVSLISGIIFAIGLAISGMVNPEKVKGFLNIFGNWDYSLALVMAGAVGFNLFTFRILVKRKPLWSTQHFLPEKADLDWSLIIGSALFGIGWGLAGICPGPGLVNLTTLSVNATTFVIAMLAGMYIYKLVERK